MTGHIAWPRRRGHFPPRLCKCEEEGTGALDVERPLVFDDCCNTVNVVAGVDGVSMTERNDLRVHLSRQPEPANREEASGPGMHVSRVLSGLLCRE